MPAPIAQILACTEVSTAHLLNPFLGRRTYYQYFIAHLAAGRQRHLPLSQLPGSRQFHGFAQRLHLLFAFQIHHRPTVYTFFI